MPHEVIMPALGMAQDMGKLIAWSKAPGDKVAAGDVLFEVETDKATMEVEAQADGWLASVSAEAGADVPVGEVIARIVDTADEAVTAGKPRTSAAVSEAAPAPTEAPQAPAPAEQPAAKAPCAASPAGRTLASPKARRLARERGLDLSRLVAAGRPQPFHAADLEALAALPDPRLRGTSAATQPITLEAAVDAAEFDALIAGLGAERSRTLAAFAARALRQSARAGPIVVELRTGKETHTLADPDLARPQEPAEAPPAFVLRDLTASRITKALTGAAHLPTLTVTRSQNAFTIVLQADPDHMDEDTALDLISGLAERIEDPLRQLL